MAGGKYLQAAGDPYGTGDIQAQNIFVAAVSVGFATNQPDDSERLIAEKYQGVYASKGILGFFGFSSPGWYFWSQTLADGFVSERAGKVKSGEIKTTDQKIVGAPGQTVKNLLAPLAPDLKAIFVPVFLLVAGLGVLAVFLQFGRKR